MFLFCICGFFADLSNALNALILCLHVVFDDRPPLHAWWLA